jgi:hypothetical protein
MDKDRAFHLRNGKTYAEAEQITFSNTLIIILVAEVVDIKSRRRTDSISQLPSGAVCYTVTVY